MSMRFLRPSLVLRLSAALALAAAAAVPTTAHSAAPGLPIQPGMAIETAGISCTANFVFDGIGKLRGRHYLGTAAHCTEDEIGAPSFDAAGQQIGKVAFSAWPYGDYSDDYAFIEILRSEYGRVTPAMAGHPSLPSGLAGDGVGATGDGVQLSGWGFATEARQELREQRPAVLKSRNARFWFAWAPVSNGDSGGPVVHLPTGGALGSVSNFCVPLPVDHGEGFEPGCTGFGPTISGILADAAAHGFTVKVRPASAGPLR